MNESDSRYIMDLVENHSQLSKRVAALEKKLKEPQPDSAPMSVVEEVLEDMVNEYVYTTNKSAYIASIMNVIRARKG